MLRNLVDAVAVLGLPEHVDEMPFSIGVLLAQTQRVLEQLIDVEVRRLVAASARRVERLQPAVAEESATCRSPVGVAPLGVFVATERLGELRLDADDLPATDRNAVQVRSASAGKDPLLRLQLERSFEPADAIDHEFCLTPEPGSERVDGQCRGAICGVRVRSL